MCINAVMFLIPQLELAVQYWNTNTTIIGETVCLCGGYESSSQWETRNAICTHRGVGTTIYDIVIEVQYMYTVVDYIELTLRSLDVRSLPRLAQPYDLGSCSPLQIPALPLKYSLVEISH